MKKSCNKRKKKKTKIENRKKKNRRIKLFSSAI